MVRVALIANTDWYLYNFRLSLVKALQENDYDVMLISPLGEYVNLLEAQGIKWYQWQVGRQSLSPLNELNAIRKLSHLYQQLNPDLVHHHTIKPVLYGGIAAQRAKIPAVVASITGRGYIFQGHDSRSRLLEQFVKPFYRWVMKNKNNWVIFETRDDQQFFIKEGLVKPEQTHLIESVGVDPEHFYPTPEPNGSTVILQASRMLWDKGVGVLIESARILKQRGLEFKIVLVGAPDPGNPTSITEEQLQAWEEEKLVEWWGFQDDMQRIYAQCHIVVLPSFYKEGVPTGVIEAAACGRPIVASDIPGCRTVVNDGNTGLLVPVKQPKPLADAIERLILDPDLRDRMGKAAREHILKRFTHHKINQQTLEVYDYALTRRA